MFTREFDRRVYRTLAVLAIAAVTAFSFGAYALWPSNTEAGYQPEQPIPYSHARHAGDLKIDCLYCHSNADKGAHATVPPVSTCMNCHGEVRPKDAQGNLKPGVATLLQYWEKKEPIRWNKVHDLADFAYFDHSRHVNAGVACQDCHGPVETMVHVQRLVGMKMSWCLDCHKQPPAPDASPTALARGTRAPIHCTTCHR